MIMDIFEAILLFFVSWFIVRVCVTYLEQKQKNNDETFDLPTVLNIESYNGILYMYRDKDNTFMGQGFTFEELAKELSQRGVKKAVISHNQELILIKDGTILGTMA